MEMPKTIEAAIPKKAEAKKYGLLTVERRALITDDATLNIENIARLSTSTSSQTRLTSTSDTAKLLLGLSLIVFLIGLLIGSDSAFLLATICAGILAGIALTRDETEIRPEKVMHYLYVVTNDGGILQFWAPEKQTIESVRRIITDKINDDTEPTVYNVNFEQGTIQNMGIGNVGSIGAVVSGQGNSVTAAAGNARAGTVETTTITNIVDYSESLPIVSQWKAYLEDRNETQLARKFGELEVLLKAGTPNTESRGRLRSLLDEMSPILSSSANAMALFSAIRNLAGF